MVKTKVVAVAMALGTGALLFAMRKELRRYVQIIRSSSNPHVVGQSITPQGNEHMLGREQKKAA